MDKHQATKTNIIKAAMKLANTNDLHDISVRAICDNAGISRNTFYQYFDNKEAVFGGTFASSEEEKLKTLPEILLSFDSPLEQFWEFLKIDINRQMALGPNMLGHFAVMNVQHDSFCIETEEDLSRSLTIALALLKKMQHVKEIKNTADPFLLLQIICGSFISIDLRWTKTNGAFDFKQMIYQHVMAILMPVTEISNY